MAKPLYMALLFSVVLADAAAAQTSGTAGTTQANPYGAVTLPGATVTPSTAATAPSNSAASTSSGGGSGGGGGAGAGAGAGASAPATSPASSGSAAAGTAARSTSNNVRAWLLCPPSGATGMAPFVTGTDLSCAP
jgi:hypothetical protein